MTEFLESALRYVARGWSILPIGAAKKVALRTWKRYQKQRPDHQQIKRWFAGPTCMAWPWCAGLSAAVCGTNFHQLLQGAISYYENNDLRMPWYAFAARWPEGWEWRVT